MNRLVLGRCLIEMRVVEMVIVCRNGGVERIERHGEGVTRRRFDCLEPGLCRWIILNLERCELLNYLIQTRSMSSGKMKWLTDIFSRR